MKKVKNGQAGFGSTIETMLLGEVKNEVKNGQKVLTFIKHTTKCQQTQQSPVSKTSTCLQGFACGQKMFVKWVLQRSVILGLNPASPT